ncbi:hypothetical protein JL720_12850 [Aureococcus anophagefferens]|nr:hypothetical protein JL720_12850 [Aureococcus anophagefferens]
MILELVSQNSKTTPTLAMETRMSNRTAVRMSTTVKSTYNNLLYGVAVTRAGDNHYAMDLPGTSGASIVKAFTANYAQIYPIANKSTTYAFSCEQHDIIDPTGFSIQTDLDFMSGGYRVFYEDARLFVAMDAKHRGSREVADAVGPYADVVEVLWVDVAASPLLSAVQRLRYSNNDRASFYKTPWPVECYFQMVVPELLWALGIDHTVCIDYDECWREFTAFEIASEEKRKYGIGNVLEGYPAFHDAARRAALVNASRPQGFAFKDGTNYGVLVFNNRRMAAIGWTAWCARWPSRATATSAIGDAILGVKGAIDEGHRTGHSFIAFATPWWVNKWRDFARTVKGQFYDHDFPRPQCGAVNLIWGGCLDASHGGFDRPMACGLPRSEPDEPWPPGYSSNYVAYPGT